MPFYYSDPTREDLPNALPDIQVWVWNDGWYWWACFPGCPPDGELNGPFDTEEEALTDARQLADARQND